MLNSIFNPVTLKSAAMALGKWWNSVTEEPSPPFRITDVQIASTNKDGSIIIEYGYEIKASMTQFLKPKLTIESDVEGAFDILVNVFDAKLVQSVIRNSYVSVAGYSYKNNVSLKKGHNVCELTGIGGSDIGNWKQGEHRFVFFNEREQCLYTKKFIIY